MIPIRFFRRWARNALTIFALAISFAMVLSLASVSMGLHNASQERLRDSPRDLVITSITLEPSIENSHVNSYDLLRDKENFTAVMPLLTLIGKVGIPNPGTEVRFFPGDNVEIDPGTFEKRELGVLGLIPKITENFIEDDTLIVRSERLKMEGWFEEVEDPFFDTGNKDDFTSEIMLDRTIMEEFKLEEGDIVYYIGKGEVPVASLVVTGSVRSSLIGTGLTEDLVSGMGIVHLSELQYMTGYDIRPTPMGNRTDLSNVIYLDIREERTDPTAQNDIVIMLEERFPGLKVTSRESRLYRVEEEVIVLEIFSLGVAITTLFIGSLFLASIMILDVEDRKGEISVMRAIGISRRTIYLQIVKDSLLLSLIAALIGSIPGYFGSRIMDSTLRTMFGVQIQFSNMTSLVLIMTMSIFILLVLIFSIFPGYRSTTLDLQQGLASFKNR